MTLPYPPKRRGLKNSMKRTWELGLLARDMVRDRFKRSGEGSVRARAHLIERMGSLHGLPQKIGQILSLSELQEGGGFFTPLTEAPNELSSVDALLAMGDRIKRPLSQCFQSIDGNGISASLSQVYGAILKDGRKVAVKLQYPGIEEAIWTDLKALGWLTAPVGGLKRGFNLKAYQEEVGRMIREELDYQNEARMIRTFGSLALDEEGLEVPEVVEELSGERILTMTWIEGAPFHKVLEWPVADRQSLGESLLHLFLTSCFKWNYLHADPHPGNYRFFKKDGKVQIGLLDFGCVKSLERETVSALTGLIGDLIQDESAGELGRRVFGRFLDLGFNEDLLGPMKDRLVPLCRVLFEPLLRDDRFSMDGWRLGDRVSEVLGPLRWNFRFAGPADLILFIRAYQGLIQYLKALSVPVNWRSVLESVQDRGNFKRPVRGMAVNPEVNGGGGEEMRRLRVRVSEGSEVRVELSFRARAAGSLPDLIPDHLRPKLRHRAIDLGAIARQAQESDFSPGELFQLDEGPKSIRVWIE